MLCGFTDLQAGTKDNNNQPMQFVRLNIRRLSGFANKGWNFGSTCHLADIPHKSAAQMSFMRRTVCIALWWIRISHWCTKTRRDTISACAIARLTSCWDFWMPLACYHLSTSLCLGAVFTPSIDIWIWSPTGWATSSKVKTNTLANNTALHGHWKEGDYSPTFPVPHFCLIRVDVHHFPKEDEWPFFTKREC